MPFSDWEGVTVGTTTGGTLRVTELTIGGRGLSGEIDALVNPLTGLKILDLGAGQQDNADGPPVGRNRLRGRLQSFDFANLTGLRYLNLGWNSFDGPIPTEIGQLAHLEYLDLGHNQLDGTLPASIGNLSNLRYLDLSSNALSGGIPSAIGNTINLAYLDLSSNAFVGTIPHEFWTLNRLEHLDLSRNADVHNTPSRLSIGDPSHVGKLFKLEHLDLRQVSIGQPIPTTIGNLRFLTHLNLAEAQLSGTIPAALWQLRRLEHLDLSHNGLTGPFPSAAATLVDLERLYLPGNNLSGTISPAFWDGGANLTHLVLDNNLLDRWSLPSSIRTLNNLEHLSLVETNLTGRIPREIGDLTNLKHLSLRANDLTGSIPFAIGDLSQLEALYLDTNSLTGTMSHRIGNLSNLEELVLYGNDLSGTIPATIGDLDKLKTLWLSDNSISGRLPPDLGKLSSLRSLRLSSNGFIGELPGQLGNLSQLLDLDISDNSIEGPFPPEMARLAKLRSATLHGNRFTTPIILDASNLLFLGFDYPENGTYAAARFSASLFSRRSLRWNLQGPDGDLFSIDTSGHLRFQPSPNFEDPNDDGADNGYNMVLALDASDNAHWPELTIRVTDGDDTGLVHLCGPEPLVGTPFITAFEDEDGPSSQVRWRWEASPDGASGWVDLPGATSPDYTPATSDEGKYLRVTLTYPDPFDHTQTATASTPNAVGSVNAPPVFYEGPFIERSIKEHSRPNTPIGAPIRAIDPNCHQLTYALGSIDPHPFGISTQSGQVFLSQDGEVHYETSPTYTLTVTVHDGLDDTGNSDTSADDTATLTIAVTDLREMTGSGTAGEAPQPDSTTPPREEPAVAGPTPLPAPNERPKMIAAIPPSSMYPQQTMALQLEEHFTDPDGDPLTYSGTVSDSAVATISISGLVATIDALAPGGTLVTITASDLYGASRIFSFPLLVQEGTAPQPRPGPTVEVSPVGVQQRPPAPRVAGPTALDSNPPAPAGPTPLSAPNERPKMITAIPPSSMYPQQTMALQLEEHFTDPDGDPLTYSGTVSDSAVATISISGLVATIDALAPGGTLVTITAADLYGASRTSSFPLVVQEGTAPGGASPPAEDGLISRFIQYGPWFLAGAVAVAGVFLWLRLRRRAGEGV